MTFTERRIDNQYSSFVESAPCIEDYFQIPHSKYKLTRLTNREFRFEIRKERCNFVGIDLPTELRIHINSFLYEFKVVSYKMSIPYDYPFRPPQWTVELVNTNIPSKQDELAVYYQNRRYDVSWSPAISFEKDILNMIDSYETCLDHCI